MKLDDFYKNRRFYVYFNTKKQPTLKTSEKKNFLKKNPSEEESPEKKLA